MPTYDYLCDANGRVVEVYHPMAETLQTWAELCARSGLEPGGTPPDSPVRRLANGGNVVASQTLSNPEPACGSGACCPSGVCGLD